MNEDTNLSKKIRHEEFSQQISQSLQGIINNYKKNCIWLHDDLFAQ